LRAIGELGKRAFSSPEDARVYAAIFELSEVKEARAVRPELVRQAEQRLEQALAGVSFISEASRLSRLYWWTAEYGLVGTPRDYRLYGAGLLSSLWESHACHDGAVSKLPLSADCVNQGYDITRTQPQLFVARDFEHLFSVLAEVDATLVHHAGGDRALSAALRSEELATFHFRDERFITGKLSAVLGNANDGLLTFQGRVGLGAQGRLQHVRDASGPAWRVPVGKLASGAELASQLARPGQHVSLRFASGVLLEGNLVATTVDARGDVLSARLTDYRLSSERAGFSECGAEYSLFVAQSLITARAGATDPAFFPASEPSKAKVPKPHSLQERERALLALYERSIVAFRSSLGSAAVSAFADVHRELLQSFPDEWLLRWNLLECLCKLAEGGALCRTLEAELLSLELKFSHKEPIASGLRSCFGGTRRRANSLRNQHEGSGYRRGRQARLGSLRAPARAWLRGHRHGSQAPRRAESQASAGGSARRYRRLRSARRL
jgi:phenylalanine-4-hydroxylase